MRRTNDERLWVNTGVVQDISRSAPDRAFEMTSGLPCGWGKFRHGTQSYFFRSTQAAFTSTPSASHAQSFLVRRSTRLRSLGPWLSELTEGTMRNGWNQRTNSRSSLKLECSL